MRQLLRNFPPRMVSRKWVRQSSASSTFAIAAAMPPSAITVCALPSNDLQTTPTLAPCPRAAIAARNPRSEEHTSELQSLRHLVCRLLLVKQESDHGLKL